MTSKQNKILLIDDDPVQSEVLEDMLRYCYVIKSLNSGKSGLQEAREFQPDLILLDVAMPEIDGFELCEKFKSDPELKKIPVIFLSGRFKLEDKVRGFRLGGVDYITKPYEFEEVKARLNTHLSLQRALRTINEQNRTLEERIVRQTKELLKAERHAAFSLMIKGIVHNLNSPLAGVATNVHTAITMLKSLQARLDESGDDREFSDRITEILGYLDISKSSCQNMTEAVRMLMVRSHAEKKSRKEQFDLNGLLANELKFFEANLAFRNKISKEISLDDRPLPVEAIPAEIVQVFHNLMENAIEEAAGRPNGKIAVATGQDGNEIWFTVSDNGTGIPAENLEQIFDPFFSTKSGDGEQSSGLGLGLYYCREIINSLGGKIAVESEQGTCFRVTLPAAA